MIRHILETAVRAVTVIPYGFDFNRDRFWNVRSARNTIQLCRDLRITPTTLVDIGANNSQWAIWLKREWPQLEVISFEPNPNFTPIGQIQRIALGDAPGRVKMTTEGGQSHVDVKGQVEVAVERFDSLQVKFHPPAVLKIDCENYTAKALAGFGERLRDFAVVVVEMWNYYPHLEHFTYQQADIWETMLRYDKRFSRVVDTEWTSRDGVPHFDQAFYSKTAP